MRLSVKLGEAFRIPIYIHWTFLLLPVLVLFNTAGAGLSAFLFSVLLVLAIFGCVLLHELGHAQMARYFGIGTRDITLYPIGGVASLESVGRRPHEELAIAVAGPAVNLVLMLLLSPFVVLAFATGAFAGGLTIAASQGFVLLALQFLSLLCVANGVLLFFNMLPAFPMDGGRVLRSILAMIMPRLQATEVAAAVGLVMAGLFVVGAFLSGNFMLGVLALFVGFAGQQELRVLRYQEQEQLTSPLPPRRTSMLRPPFIGPVTVVPEPEVVPVRPAWFVPRVESPETPPTSSPAWGHRNSAKGIQGPPNTLEPHFTGCAYDEARGVWVLWHDGQPVRTFGVG